MNYTKGDWKIHNQDFRSGDELVIHPGVGKDGIYSFYCKVGGADKVANAHLIAVAPDMYEALKAISPFIENHAKESSWAKQATQIISQAISKAEGK